MLNKVDLYQDHDERKEVVQDILTRLNWTGKTFQISAIQGTGTDDLCYSLMQLIDEMRNPEA